MLAAGGFFDYADHKNIGIGEVVIVAGGRPGGDSKSCAGASTTEPGIVTSLHGDASAFRNRGERKDDALHTLVEYAFGQPELGPRDACKDREGSPRVASTRVRSNSSDSEECSISLQRKWNPSVAAYTPASTSRSCHHIVSCLQAFTDDAPCIRRGWMPIGSVLFRHCANPPS